MSAIVVNEGFDIAALPAHLAQRLPTYARPVFIRISRELDATETFKQKKGELAREGFDPGAISDPLFMLEPASGAYVALDAETYAQVVDGAIRLQPQQNPEIGPILSELSKRTFTSVR
jgi:fatty-acyl-CoA synthase